MKATKAEKERATDYVRRSWEDVTVGELMRFLDNNPKPANTYNNRNRKLERLRDQLVRYLDDPGTMIQEEPSQFEQQFFAMYLSPNRATLAWCYSFLKKNYERLGWPVPSLSSIRRKVRSLPPEVIAFARG